MAHSTHVDIKYPFAASKYQKPKTMSKEWYVKDRQKRPKTKTKRQKKRVASDLPGLGARWPQDEAKPRSSFLLASNSIRMSFHLIASHQVKCASLRY